MIIPLPFSRTIFVYGDPIVVPRDADHEEWRLRIEQSMNELAERVERDFDRLWDEGRR